MIITPLHKLISQHEGFRSKAYVCSEGHLTVGFGRNLEDLGVSEEEAYQLLDNDIKRCVQESKIRFPWFESLDQVRRDVVISMVFNLGISRLLNFKEFLHAMSVNDFKKASEEMLNSHWAKQVKSRANELSEMMKSGLYKTS